MPGAQIYNSSSKILPRSALYIWLLMWFLILMCYRWISEKLLMSEREHILPFSVVGNSLLPILQANNLVAFTNFLFHSHPYPTHQAILFSLHLNCSHDLSSSRKPYCHPGGSHHNLQLDSLSRTLPILESLLLQHHQGCSQHRSQLSCKMEEKFIWLPLLKILQWLSIRRRVQMDRKVRIT